MYTAFESLFVDPCFVSIEGQGYACGVVGRPPPWAVTVYCAYIYAEQKVTQLLRRRCLPWHHLSYHILTLPIPLHTLHFLSAGAIELANLSTRSCWCRSGMAGRLCQQPEQVAQVPSMPHRSPSCSICGAEFVLSPVFILQATISSGVSRGLDATVVQQSACKTLSTFLGLNQICLAQVSLIRADSRRWGRLALPKASIALSAIHCEVFSVPCLSLAFELVPVACPERHKASLSSASQQRST